MVAEAWLAILAATLARRALLQAQERGERREAALGWQLPFPKIDVSVTVCEALAAGRPKDDLLSS